MSDIEKIRAEVAKVREEHYRVEGYADYCGASHAPGTLWPCRFLQLAEDKLKLAEAIAEFRAKAGFHLSDHTFDSTVSHCLRCEESYTIEEERIERVLSEVAR
jgi:chorismate mutase